MAVGLLYKGLRWRRRGVNQNWSLCLFVSVAGRHHRPEQTAPNHGSGR